MSENIRQVIRTHLDVLDRVGATTPNIAAEYYELSKEQHQELLDVCVENAHRLASQGFCPLDRLAANLYFSILIGAKLHQKGIIP